MLHKMDRASGDHCCLPDQFVPWSDTAERYHSWRKFKGSYEYGQGWSSLGRFGPSASTVFISLSQALFLDEADTINAMNCKRNPK